MKEWPAFLSIPPALPPPPPPPPFSARSLASIPVVESPNEWEKSLFTMGARWDEAGEEEEAGLEVTERETAVE